MPKVIVFKQRGNWDHTRKFLKHASKVSIDLILEKYGQKGVDALASATPKATGKTAASWVYKITKTAETLTITWSNTNIVNGVPIAVILQYGHATRNGGYVEGVDYINPAIKPVFEEIARQAWGEVIME